MNRSQRPNRDRARWLLLAAGPLTAAAWLGNGCSATAETTEFTTGSDSTGANTTQGTSAGGAGSGSTSTGEGGGQIVIDGGTDAPPDVPINPCGSECGDTELCDDAHIGLDDDCDGLVDEGCPCQLGQAHACFKGDPSYHGSAGCFDGTQKCTENGNWGPCIGGVHATEGCFQDQGPGCHPISAVPFQDVDLKTGTGTFSADATAESWTVACPPGVDPCPAVGGANPADDFKPLQSGEYTVTYTKTGANGEESCSYPLFVGARGLRVELEWEHDLGSDGVDLDLHLHQPGNTLPWSLNGLEPQDCGYGNCTATAFEFGFGTPSWFSDAAMEPDPVNWTFDEAVFENNTCFFAPRGAGQTWQDMGMGCHNPRLDIDNITCDPGVSDPDDYSFCAPENINVDIPPKDQWTRVGVHYYSNHSLGYDVHPVIKIYCDGALAAELGSQGYNVPVTFTPADNDRFWAVADVLFKPADECNASACTVQPLYADPVEKTLVLQTSSAAQSSFTPAYPPLP